MQSYIKCVGRGRGGGGGGDGGGGITSLQYNLVSNDNNSRVQKGKTGQYLPTKKLHTPLSLKGKLQLSKVMPVLRPKPTTSIIMRNTSQLVTEF